jgi:hypothetical protein
MSKGRKSPDGSMLSLWRPPREAGDPVGCLATTYTFAPELFDEQCLAYFLAIDSEPDREDLPFLLERETRLGSVYAGILVDHTQSGVEHSLRWDVLPVRVRGGKQHAKLSLLVWGGHVRIIVTSANLTKQGYRVNREVAVAVDLKPADFDSSVFTDTIAFLRRLLRLVPGNAEIRPEAGRAERFLADVERQVRDWKPRARGDTVRRHLAGTMPPGGNGQPPRSSLTDAFEACRRRGGSPNRARVASPFFDVNDENGRVTAEFCKAMARGGARHITFCVPSVDDGQKPAISRLAAPRTLLEVPKNYQGEVTIEVLPAVDEDKNPRPWHAKMLGLQADGYTAVMVGSSNFTAAGMGIGQARNVEANLVTVVDRVAYGREEGELEKVWPEMKAVPNPETAKWLGVQLERDEEQAAGSIAAPEGFLAAVYRAGERRFIALHLDAGRLPDKWNVRSCGREERPLLSDSEWCLLKQPSSVDVPWEAVQPPEKLLVEWDGQTAFLPINVEDSRALPKPEKLEQMSSEDMLGILAASDPSAAFRTWARRQQAIDEDDDDLDSATPIDLDPLRRYDLQETFLHRVRNRARVLARLAENLQRPVWSRQALEWRLRGLVGVQALAERMAQELVKDGTWSDEALLTLADLLIVLRDVEYESGDGCLPKSEFEKIYRPFLGDLVVKLRQEVKTLRGGASPEIIGFWERVVQRCVE